MIGNSYDKIFKYVLHGFILYILINKIINKKCFQGNEKNIIMVCFVSSFIFFVMDSFDTPIEKKSLHKKDFLSNIKKDVILNNKINIKNF